jgi:proteasome accessory factor B
MKSDPNPPDPQASRPPLERMMKIHAELVANRFPNAVQLGNQFEVSSKTILRDLEFMRDRLMLPVEFNSSRRGFYYSEEVDAFPTLSITEGELISLLIAEKALQQYRGTPFERKLQAAVRKLADTLPSTVSVNMADWDQSISFRTTAEPLLDLPLLEKLAQAIQRRQEIAFGYRKPGGERIERRTVEPYHLTNVNGDWYLFGYDQLRKAIRTFVPARMRDLEMTGRRFTKPEGFELRQQLKDSFGVHSREGEFRVILVCEASIADYIREKKWHPSQKTRELGDGKLELELKLGSLKEIQRWILGWGGAVRVVAPEELKTGIHNAAKALIKSSK